VPSPWERKSAFTRDDQNAFKTHKPNSAIYSGSLEGYMTARALADLAMVAREGPFRH
jgi:branched-subunit amino acid permease